MPTECNRDLFGYEVVEGRQVVAAFDGGEVTSDAGALLLGATDRAIGLMTRFAACFDDGRDPAQIEHRIEAMVAQRVFGIALGYEDLNDHDQLRHDPVLATLAGKLTAKRRDCAPLAGKSTLNRLEHAPSVPDRYHKIGHDAAAIEGLFVALFLEAHKTPPHQIILDLDATDDPLHGHQEGRFFHGYYDCYCYLPLYIFCGEQLLCARLRPSNQDAATGSVEELERIVTQIRAHWPKTRIVIRGDAGFCREAIMRWCEDNRVRYVLGLARNKRLQRALGKEMAAAKAAHERTGNPARRFRDFRYRTRKSWSCERRVIGKAEYLPNKANPRFVVTNLTARDASAKRLYERLYCARGDMENRIKEQQLGLFADRTSTATMRANQLRLYFSSFAYVLMQGLRRLGLAGTAHAKAQSTTIRLKLLKIGARIRITVRKVWLSFSEAYPYADDIAVILANIRRHPAWAPPG
jgi:hypothetical protein